MFNFTFALPIYKLSIKFFSTTILDTPAKPSAAIRNKKKELTDHLDEAPSLGKTP